MRLFLALGLLACVQIRAPYTEGGASGSGGPASGGSGSQSQGDGADMEVDEGGRPAPAPPPTPPHHSLVLFQDVSASLFSGAGLDEFEVFFRSSAVTHHQELPPPGGILPGPNHYTCAVCESSGEGGEWLPLDSADWDPGAWAWNPQRLTAAKLYHSVFRTVLGRTGTGPWPCVSFSRKFKVVRRMALVLGGNYNDPLVGTAPPPASAWEPHVGNVHACVGPYIIIAVPLTNSEGEQFVSLTASGHLRQAMASHVGWSNSCHALRMGRVYDEVVVIRAALGAGEFLVATFQFRRLPQWVRHWSHQNERPLRHWFLTQMLNRGGFS